MPAIVDTVTELGTGDYEGQLKILEYGPEPERVGMRWRTDIGGGTWVGDERVCISTRDGWILSANSIHQPGTFWGYVTAPIIATDLDVPDNRFGESSYSWNPRTIRHADAAFAAGLTLQEKIILDAWTWEPTDSVTLATVFFPMNQGDPLDNVVLVPDDFIGTQVNTLPGLRRFQVVAWHDSDVQSCAKHDMLPHLYSNDEAAAAAPNVIEYFTAFYRWVGNP